MCVKVVGIKMATTYMNMCNEGTYIWDISEFCMWDNFFEMFTWYNCGDEDIAVCASFSQMVCIFWDISGSVFHDNKCMVNRYVHVCYVVPVFTMNFWKEEC